jgi:pyridoxal phosphate enzyme (YggS family)
MQKVVDGMMDEAQGQLASNLQRVEDAIAEACRAAGRKREEVELIAVSKTHPTAAIAEAARLGLYQFGESRVQEWSTKAAELGAVRDSIRVHLIGHLQSNKAAKAAELFDAIDSVDSLKLAERLDEGAGKLGKRLPVLLEIKLSAEETKAGFGPGSADLAELLERATSLTNLKIDGLMTIAPLDAGGETTRECFRALRLLRDKISREHPKLDLPVLSMGMSGDFALAIAEGSTRVRIGTALFGARPKPA